MFFSPEEFKFIADVDPWDKYLNVTILREDSRLVSDAIREGALLLSSPMRGYPTRRNLSGRSYCSSPRPDTAAGFPSADSDCGMSNDSQLDWCCSVQMSTSSLGLDPRFGCDLGSRAGGVDLSAIFADKEQLITSLWGRVVAHLPDIEQNPDSLAMISLEELKNLLQTPIIIFDPSLISPNGPVCRSQPLPPT
jgi:hypothetical protein